MKDSPKTFLKGILMGIADIIPGISGGTIALILGIYERLINAIKSISDFKFLIPLGLGIFTAIIAGSFTIPYLLDTYPAYIFAFFTGLILGSIKIIYKRIKLHKISGFTLGILGFILAFVITGLKLLQINHSYLIIFFSGIIAISAMLLPGISGSYILLVLGQYKFMLTALKDINIPYILIFIAGAIIGLIFFSRIISYLLKLHHSLEHNIMKTIQQRR